MPGGLSAHLRHAASQRASNNTTTITNDYRYASNTLADEAAADDDSDGIASYLFDEPLQAATTATSTTATPYSPALAAHARATWQTHGSAVTQSHEERRAQGGGPLSVRIVATMERHDVNDAVYTTYVIHLTQQQQQQSWVLEKRYSEFCKLDALLKHYSIQLPSPFPRKHWAGRLGNWTPSKTWAPNQHDQLIEYRMIQLDVWLVDVVAWYQQQQRQQQQSSSLQVATAIWHFLTDPPKPPCQQENTLACTANTNNNNNNNNHHHHHHHHHHWNNPFCFTLASMIRQATHTMNYMVRSNNTQSIHNRASGGVLYQADQSIPLDLLQAAKGLVFLTVIKAGMVVSGRIGTGLVIARHDDSSSGGGGWSAPCALATVGMGWGALIGGDVTHYLVVLTTEKAVQDLVSSKSIQLGAELGVAVGPLGRGAHGHVATGDWTLHPAYAYAHSQGLFVGMSLEGSVVTVRNDVNYKFYGGVCEAKDLLRQSGPKAAEPLYNAIQNALSVTIPEGSFRPTRFFSPEKLVSNSPCGNRYPPRDYNHPAFFAAGSGSASAMSASNNSPNYFQQPTERPALGVPYSYSDVSTNHV